RVIEDRDMLKAITRAALRPAIAGAKVAIASPRAAFVVLALVWSALVALLAALAFVPRGAAARRTAFAATFLVALGLAVAIGLPDRDPGRASSTASRVASRPEADGGPARSIVRRHRRAERGVGRYDGELGRSPGWALAPGAARVRPTLSSGAPGYQIESDLANGILTADGFTVTDPKAAAALDIASGDRITGINGYPPAGGAFANILLMQRDPDRNMLEVLLERDGVLMRRTIVVR